MIKFNIRNKWKDALIFLQEKEMEKKEKGKKNNH